MMFRSRTVGADAAAGVHRAKEVVRRDSNELYLASYLLPASKRRATLVISAFCQLFHALVEHPDPQPERLRKIALLELRVERALGGAPDNDLLAAFATVVERYALPQRAIFDFIESKRCEIRERRYQTFAELRTFCDLSASSLAVLLLPIFGSEHPRAQEYIVNLSRAMQLTDLLRNISADAQRDRICIPQDEMLQFGCKDRDILEGRMSDRFVALLQFQISRIRSISREALPALALLSPDSRYAARYAARLFREYLTHIEKHDYHVFERGTRVANSMKFMMAVQERLRKTG